LAPTTSLCALPSYASQEPDCLGYDAARFNGLSATALAAPVRVIIEATCLFAEHYFC
jgi:hypothetical protein